MDTFITVDQYSNMLKTSVVFIIQDGYYEECIWNNYYIRSENLNYDTINNLIHKYAETLDSDLINWDVYESNDTVIQNGVHIKLFVMKYEKPTIEIIWLIPCLLDWVLDKMEIS